MSRTALVGLLTFAGALPCLAADDDKWSTVKGRVVYDNSKVPIPKRVAPNIKGAALPPCAAIDKEFLTEDWVVDVKTKGIRDVVVWLAPECGPVAAAAVTEGRRQPASLISQLEPC
jgi:hypothetical protein